MPAWNLPRRGAAFKDDIRAKLTGHHIMSFKKPYRKARDIRDRRYNVGSASNEVAELMINLIVGILKPVYVQSKCIKR